MKESSKEKLNGNASALIPRAVQLPHGIIVTTHTKRAYLRTIVVPNVVFFSKRKPRFVLNAELCLLGSRPDLQSPNPVSELLPALGCDILSA